MIFSGSCNLRLSIQASGTYSGLSHLADFLAEPSTLLPDARFTAVTKIFSEKY